MVCDAQFKAASYVCRVIFLTSQDCYPVSGGERLQREDLSQCKALWEAKQVANPSFICKKRQENDSVSVTSQTRSPLLTGLPPTETVFLCLVNVCFSTSAVRVGAGGWPGINFVGGLLISSSPSAQEQASRQWGLDLEETAGNHNDYFVVAEKGQREAR